MACIDMICKKCGKHMGMVCSRNSEPNQIKEKLVFGESENPNKPTLVEMVCANCTEIVWTNIKDALPRERELVKLKYIDCDGVEREVSALYYLNGWLLYDCGCFLAETENTVLSWAY